MRLPPTMKQTLGYVKVEEDEWVNFKLRRKRQYFATSTEKKLIFTGGRLTLNKTESKMMGNMEKKKQSGPICVKCHNRVKNTNTINYEKYKVCSTFCRKNL